MIVFPYFDTSRLTILGLSIFLATSLLAIATGFALVPAASRRVRLPVRTGYAAVAMAVLVGYTISHVFALSLYHRDLLAERPLFYLLDIDNGLSSVGGLLGGLAGGILYATRAAIAVSRTVDLLTLCACPAWAVGRVGCYLIHDHPGLPSTGFLAVDYPGGPRHDLGLYEFLWLVVVTAVLWARRSAVRRPGTTTARFVALYAAARLYLDSLRLSPEQARELSGSRHGGDERYGGMTPAQYVAAAALLGVAVWWLHTKKQRAQTL
jgi:phosphatidylglycerol:prolipoprotein diacylglycerol transferase